MEQQFDIDPKLIDELAKSIKSEKDLAALSKHLLKLTVLIARIRLPNSTAE